MVVPQLAGIRLLLSGMLLIVRRRQAVRYFLYCEKRFFLKCDVGLIGFVVRSSIFVAAMSN